MIRFQEKDQQDPSLRYSTVARALRYGDAVFEEVRVSGGKVLFWEDHYFRLMANMRIMRMEIPMQFTPEYLEAEILDLVGNVPPAAAYSVNLLVWRQGNASQSVDHLIEVQALKEPFFTGELNLNRVELFKDHYSSAGLLSSVNTTNQALQVLARIFARENDYDSCLLLNDKKMVVGAIEGNIFLLNGYTIKTPPVTDGVANEVMRKKLLEVLAEDPDYVVEIASISPFELQRADELWVTTPQEGIRPVLNYRKKEYGQQLAAELVKKLNVKARLG